MFFVGEQRTPPLLLMIPAELGKVGITTLGLTALDLIQYQTRQVTTSPASRGNVYRRTTYFMIYLWSSGHWRMFRNV